MSLLGDPYFYRVGRTFNFIVVSCSIYAAQFNESSSGCLDDGEVVNNIRIAHKYINKYWDKDSYDPRAVSNTFPSDSYGATQYDIDHEVSNSNRFSIQQEKISVYDKKLFTSELGLFNEANVVLERYSPIFLSQSSLKP